MPRNSGLTRAAGAVAVIAVITLLSAGPASSAPISRGLTDPRPSQQAATAIAGGRAAVASALRAGDVQVTEELLKRATVTDTETPAPALIGDGLAASTVCHGAVVHRTT